MSAADIATRGRTLHGIAPVPQSASNGEHTPSMPPASSPSTASSDDGRSKFEAAAQLLEQARASQAPKPRAAEANADTKADAPEIDAPPSKERVDAAPKSRRPSVAPPPQRQGGIILFALAAAVFVMMFLAGAMKAMREELSDAKPSAKTPVPAFTGSPVEKPRDSPPALQGTPSAIAPLPPPVVAPLPPAIAETAAPASADSTVTPSAEPAQAGEAGRVLVRSAISGAKFFRYGKLVGTNSVIVELAPGEKRAFEVDLPGYVSRKVVIDGSRSEVVVILPRISETPAPTHASDEPAPAGQTATAAAHAESTP